MKLFVTFEVRSKKIGHRVKGISFHPYRPWILTSLHNGNIELYDYRQKIVVDTFQEHEGACRCVAFHHTLPLFVSGGDDYKVKVWDYQRRKCLFTLSGHTDYVRSVEFHPEQPWIVSGSDDQYIRIWNYQSRKCLTTIAGHHHYVMCARFHPTDDLLVTCSLDQEIRVWDISALKHTQYTKSDFLNVSKLNREIFGNNDVVLKFVMTGHERGVNWVSFHPTSRYIISGADDKQVKLWRYKDDEGWEVDSFLGHSHNVSSVVFHPKKDLVISNSEDHTMRFWSLSKGTLLDKYEEKTDNRFWMLALHPHHDLVAAGHDSGFMVFKKDREKAPFHSTKTHLFYVKDEQVRKYSYKDASDTAIGGFYYSTRMPVVTIDVSTNDKAVILTRITKKGERTCDFLSFPKTPQDLLAKTYTSLGTHCVFIGNKRFCRLQDEEKIIVKRIGETKRTRFDPKNSIGAVKGLWKGNSGRIICQTVKKIYLFDVEQNLFITNIPYTGLKHVSWNDSYSLVALQRKLSVIICDRELKVLCVLKEHLKVKSIVWYGDVLIYSTMTQLKYALKNGDRGVLQTLEQPIYLCRANSKGLWFINRKKQVKKMQIDSVEFRFKQALLDNDQREIRRIIANAKMLGESIISYLHERGYPKIAMKFVKDERTKFNLAVECGDIQTALASAKKIDSPECWELLSNIAIKHGDHAIVERAYKKTKSYDSLCFLKFITGQPQPDVSASGVMTKFYSSLFSGNVKERVELLKAAGQHKLAFVCAKRHGIEYEGETFELDESDFPEFTPMVPPKPLLVQENWPLLYSESLRDEEDVFVESDEEGEDEEGNLDIWGGDDLIPTGGDSEEEEKPDMEEDDDGDAWGGGIDVQDDVMQEVLVQNQEDQFRAPSFGTDPIDLWKSSCASKTGKTAHLALISAGMFKLAMKRMGSSWGITNFAPLKSYFMNMYVSSKVQLAVPFKFPGLSLCLNKESDTPIQNAFRAKELLEIFEKKGCKMVTKGNFEGAGVVFLELLHSCAFVKDVENLEKLLNWCREYVVGIKMERERKKIKVGKRCLELAAYFSRCNLKQKHLKLTVFQAMSLAFKSQNYVTAAGFADRLLQLAPPKKMEKQALYVQKFVTSHETEKFKIDYDPRNPFVMCTVDLVPIYAGSDSVQCLYCKAHAQPKHTNVDCTICGLSKYGRRGKKKKRVYDDDEALPF